MSSGQVTTAVLPVAGMGTRFLPVTKASPKEMLPIIDKPLIHYAVQEAIDAGITRLIFVTSYTKRAIEDYFDTNYEMESRLAARGKTDLLAKVQGMIPNGVSIAYVRQPEPRGLGDAILCAAPLVGDQPFAVLLADDVIASSGQPDLKTMIQRYQRSASSVLAVEEVAPQDTGSYGIVSLAGDSREVTSIVEKPDPSVAPSTLAVIGRYVLSPAIMPLLQQAEPGVGGEVQLTDAIAQLLQRESVEVHAISGKRYDCGSKEGWFEATLEFACQNPRLAAILEKKRAAAVEE